VVVTVITTFKSGGDMSPPAHTRLRLWIYMPLSTWIHM